MKSSTAMKKEFLTKWSVALQMCSTAKDDEGGKEDKPSSAVMLRKKAIKLSADVAMASTRSPSTLWSRALMSNPRNSPIARRLLGTDKFSGASWATLSKRRTRRIVNMSRKRKTTMIMSKKKRVNSGNRSMVKKRTEVLRSLVPGGEDMEEWRLIKEALDYVVCLRVQVDVMKLLATATAAATGSAGAANVYDENPK